MFWPLMQNTITWTDRLKLAKFVMTADRFTKGPETTAFEKEWSDWLGVRNSLFVSSGSTANFLLLAACKELYGWDSYTNILVPATTWTTGVAPIIQLGMNPVFADVDEDFGININWLMHYNKKLPKIDGVFYAHLLGLSSNVEKIKDFFPGAVIMQDLCESHGIEDKNGAKRGTEKFSVGSTFSFYYGHHMTTIEGGMVSTNDDELYNIMRIKRSHGMYRELDFNKPHGYRPSPDRSDFWFVTDGYNFRNTDLAAVLGRSQLKRLDDMIDARVDNFDEYMSLILLYDFIFCHPTYVQKDRNSSYAFPFIFKDNKKFLLFKALLVEEGIEHRPIISGNLLKHPAYDRYANSTPLTYPMADRIHKYGVYIGNNHFLKPKHFRVLKNILDKVAQDG